MSNRPKTPPPTAVVDSPTGTNADEEATRIFFDVIYHLTEVLFFISVIGALITIITFTIFPRIRTYPIKLIIYLCITIVVGHTIFSLSPYVTQSPFCVVTGAIVHYFLLSNFLWCGCIAFNFYQMVRPCSRPSRPNWAVPALLLLYPCEFFSVDGLENILFFYCHWRGGVAANLVGPRNPYPR